MNPSLEADHVGNGPQGLFGRYPAGAYCLLTLALTWGLRTLYARVVFHSASNTSYFWVAETFGVVQTDFFRASFLVALTVIGAVFSVLVVRQKEKVLACGAQG